MAVERDKLLSDKRQIEQDLVNGKRFFASAAAATDAWANAHADLAKAFQENRTPNLILVVARAQELKQLVEQLH